jgi:ATP-dependent DNA helicase PIF1
LVPGAIGNATEPTVLNTDLIAIPREFLLPPKPDGKPAGLNELLAYTFDGMPPPLPPSPPARTVDETPQRRQQREEATAQLKAAVDSSAAYYKDKAMLTPLNVDVTRINNFVLSSMTGQPEQTFLSADRVEAGDSPGVKYPVEFLNSLNVSGLPEHKLTLKVGAVIMLLRNLSPRDGLCNGTRILLQRAHERVLEGTIISGDFCGRPVLIPRIALKTNKKAFPFIMSRLQFPVRVAFAMTINKSQGQSLGRVGLFLPRPCFGHGQLYVALSRSGNPPSGMLGVRIVVLDTDDRSQGRLENLDGVYTRNVVYTEVFRG